jgi:hypothetical protein
MKTEKKLLRNNNLTAYFMRAHVICEQNCFFFFTEREFVFTKRWDQKNNI